MARREVLSATCTTTLVSRQVPARWQRARRWETRQDSPPAITLMPQSWNADQAKGFWMPNVTYVSPSGISRKIDVPLGMSVMQAALNHKVEGILGECGGNCMCATCHVYVDASFLSRIPPAVDNEKFMLSIAAEGPATNSRLSCQIKMTAELDGIIVRIPGKQK
jgi:2Fe-2S ferredoxin